MGAKPSISKVGVDRVLAIDDYDTIYVENDFSFRLVYSRTKPKRYSICYGDKCSVVTETKNRYDFIRQLNTEMTRLQRRQKCTFYI